MPNINELTLAKELIKFPSVTPVDAGAIGFLAKQLRILHYSNDPCNGQFLYCLNAERLCTKVSLIFQILCPILQIAEKSVFIERKF